MMESKRRHYSEEFREEVRERMRAGCKVGDLVKELKIAKSVLFRWRQSPGVSGKRRHELIWQQQARQLQEQRREIKRLQRKIGAQAMDLDFFQAALRRVGAKLPAAGNNRSARRLGSAAGRKAE
jgi:transposase-like protein